MKDETWRGLSLGQSALKRLRGKLRVETIANGPADHLAREEIEDDHQEDEPAGYRQVSSVSHPDSIRRERGEVALQPVGRDRLGVVRVNRPLPPPSPPRRQALAP